MICIKNLPYDIKQKILNYLYYSNNTVVKLNPCLKIIDLYYKKIYDEIYHKIIGHNGIYKLLLRWLNLDDNQFIYSFIEIQTFINYDLVDKTKQDDHAFVIMNQMTINQINRFHRFLYCNEYVYT